MDRYFEHVRAGGSFVREEGVGLGGSTGLRARFQEGQVSAGSLKLALGRTPDAYVAPVDGGSAVHEEIYWRFYFRTEPEWSGGGGFKLTRATSLVDEDWAQAMIAHVWSDAPPGQNFLALDPASGVLPGTDLVVTTKYNDFPNLRWLGRVRGATPLFRPEGLGRWYCIEIRVRLNDPGLPNGEFEMWIDGEPEAAQSLLDWRGLFDDYGINAIFLENYWDEGAPREQERYFDNLVVSTGPIGCLDLEEVVPSETFAETSVLGEGAP